MRALDTSFVCGLLIVLARRREGKGRRERAGVVVALGACAHLGGVNAIRNRQELSELRRYVYGDKAEWYETYPARPISAVIPVDATIPGCPIDREEFIRVVKAVLQGRAPQLPDYPVCVECKLKENVCLYLRGKTCLGPIALAGCDAICPTYGDGCEGCHVGHQGRGEATLPVDQPEGRRRDGHRHWICDFLAILARTKAQGG